MQQQESIREIKDAPADYQEQLEQLIKQPKVVAVGEMDWIIIMRTMRLAMYKLLFF